MSQDAANLEACFGCGAAKGASCFAAARNPHTKGTMRRVGTCHSDPTTESFLAQDQGGVGSIHRRDYAAKKIKNPWTPAEEANMKRLLKIYNYDDFDTVNVDMQTAAKLFALCQNLKLQHWTTKK
jgi:hypothetical protein